VTPRLPDGRINVTAAARRLVDRLLDEPWGHVSPSVYETGRLVTLAPWLTGHTNRVDFLLHSQRPDGSWSGPGGHPVPDGYAIVPTLSATEALLQTLCRSVEVNGRDRLSAAVDGGLRALFAWLAAPNGHQLSIPDTPAIEIIVPALVASINRHLDLLAGSPLSGLDAWRGDARLHPPPGMDTGLLVTIQSSLVSGAGVPAKLLHSLELAGPAARGASTVQPVPPGTVGASPAATAAWLGAPDPAPGRPSQRLSVRAQALDYLESVVARHGGPVPGVIPITMFERSWVLSGLVGAGIDVPIPAELVDSLQAPLGETGTPGGAGLPPDADTTSVTLLALAQLASAGWPDSAGVIGYSAGRELDYLWPYETETHFLAWPGERTASASLNAHVLDAVGHRVTSRPGASPRHHTAVDKLSAWLHDQQAPDGSWRDKWHASPYYPTASCALALDRFGRNGAAATVRRAVDWVLDTQRPDGSWGEWQPSAEETAYALRVLLVSGPWQDDARIVQAAARGYAYLCEVIDEPDHPPLWHDKDLYAPPAILRAEVLAAVHLAQRGPAGRVPNNT
jgi:hypothetical protein